MSSTTTSPPDLPFLETKTVILDATARGYE